jgi:hypothetical protein
MVRTATPPPTVWAEELRDVGDRYILALPHTGLSSESDVRELLRPAAHSRLLLAHPLPPNARPVVVVDWAVIANRDSPSSFF